MGYQALHEYGLTQTNAVTATNGLTHDGALPENKSERFWTLPMGDKAARCGSHPGQGIVHDRPPTGRIYVRYRDLIFARHPTAEGAPMN